MSKEEPMPFLALAHEAPYLTNLRIQTRTALRGILKDKSYTTLLERFRFTYELRSQYEMLPEGWKPTDTSEKDRRLEHAITGAIIYMPETDKGVKQSVFGRKPIDEPFLTNMREHIDHLVQHNLITIAWLQEILESQGVNSQTVTAKELEKRIAHSMQRYCEQGLRGIEE